MNKRYISTWYSPAMVLFTSLYLVGCSDSSTTPVIAPILASYSVKVVNATNNQPLSPLAVIAHDTTYSAWSVGSAATVGLENLAEGGSNAELLASLTTEASASGTGIIGPGSNDTVNITSTSVDQTRISVVTMLVNTNDAFTGLDSIDVSALVSGNSMTVSTHVYDAGTELNDEAAGTIPGPADSGTGFNSARSDTSDEVRLHRGVITADDGLVTSVLNESHRFDNPAMIVTITRD